MACTLAATGSGVGVEEVEVGIPLMREVFQPAPTTVPTLPTRSSRYASTPGVRMSTRPNSRCFGRRGHGVFGICKPSEHAAHGKHAAAPESAEQHRLEACTTGQAH